MSALPGHDHWLTTDVDGERQAAESEAREQAVWDAIAAMTFVDLLDAGRDWHCARTRWHKPTQLTFRDWLYARTESRMTQ